MEKLLNLLNEYECYRNVYNICTGWQEKDGRIVWVTDDPRPQVRSEYYILSKEFGFIKWLVENDKIDIKALVVKGEMRSGWDFDNKKGNEESGEEIWNKYYSELCLMLLSISDTPIDDLISYLK